MTGTLEKRLQKPTTARCGMRSMMAVSFWILAMMLNVQVDGAAQQGVDPQRLARIPRRMQELVDAGKIAGAVVVLVRHDGVVLLEGVGYKDLEAREPMATDTIFRMASVAKPVTAMGIMAFQEEGRLTIASPGEVRSGSYEGRLNPAPAFGLYTTARDLAALLQMLLNQGSYEGRTVLSAASVRAMTTGQTRGVDLPAHGLGWNVARQAGSLGGPLTSAEAYGHGGSGSSCGSIRSTTLRAVFSCINRIRRRGMPASCS